MGADAYIFLFDHSTYRTEVVPAFMDLLKDGNGPTWLAQIHSRHEKSLYGDFPTPQDELRIPGGVDLETHCTHLDDEFASTRAASFGSLYESNWSKRACNSMDCPERTRCPFMDDPHREEGTAYVEQVLRLFQLAVAQRCLGACQFLGRSIDSFWYWDLLDDLGIPPDGRIRRLLTRLGRRGYVVGYQWTVGTDGIHGWLSPDEAAELGECLFPLPLPDYDLSFTAMANFRRMGNALKNYPTLPSFYCSAYEHPTASFKELSLSFVRTVCLLASRDHKGVLWGNDIYPDP